MIKIFFLFVSLFTNFVSDFLISLEKEEVEVVQNYENISLYLDKNLELKKDEKIIYRFKKTDEVSFIVYNNEIIASCNDNGVVSLYRFDKNGNLVLKKTIDGKYSFFKLKLNNDTIYCYGGIYDYSGEVSLYKKDYLKQKDAFIALVDLNFDFISFCSFGGSLDEYFTDLEFCDEYLLLIGKKEELSGGDFGNGGISLFCLLDYNLSIINFLTFKEKVYKSFYDKNFIIITENCIYLFDDSLNLKNSQKLGLQSIFGAVTTNNMILIINDLELKIFDPSLLKEIYSYPFSNKISSVYDNGENLILKSENIYKLDIYDLREFIIHQIHGYRIDGVVYSLHKKLTLREIEYKEYFDPLVSGVYNVVYDFGSITVPGTYRVLEEENVSEGMIYPLGYRLIFTGTGYLNGKLINNNHALINPGNFKLELINLDSSTREINFSVDNMQINFTESANKVFDSVTLVGEKFIIEYQYDNLNDYDVIDIVSNKDVNFEIKDNTLRLITSFDSIGLKYLYIDHILYEKEGIVFKNHINKGYLVNVINDKFYLSKIFKNETKPCFYLDVSDDNNQLRGIMVKVMSLKEEYQYFYPFKNLDIVIHNLDRLSRYDVFIDMVYSIDDKNYENINLCKIEISGKSEYNLASLEIISKGKSVSEARLYLNEKNYKLYENNTFLYETKKKNYIKGILISIGIGLISFGIILFARLKWLTK